MLSTQLYSAKMDIIYIEMKNSFEEITSIRDFMYQMEAERVHLINNNKRSNRGSARDRSAERHKEHSHAPRDYNEDSTNIRASTTQERYVPTLIH